MLDSITINFIKFHLIEKLLLLPPTIRAAASSCSKMKTASSIVTAVPDDPTHLCRCAGGRFFIGHKKYLTLLSKSLLWIIDDNHYFSTNSLLTPTLTF